MRNIIDLKLTFDCNFRCKYCFNPDFVVDKKRLLNLDVDTIFKTISNTGMDWEIILTGGEPFLYPDIVSLSKRLSEKYKICFDTNLTFVNKIKEVVECIPPERISYFNISTHIEERERLGLIDEFIDTILFLKKRKYNLVINYIMHPSLFDRFEKDYMFFRSKGIEILPKPFKGRYDSKMYPFAYSKRELSLLRKYNPDFDVSSSFPIFAKGLPCNAGVNLLRITPYGDILRCPSDDNPIGNIKSGIILLDGPKKCRITRCKCFGIEYLEKDSLARFKLSFNSKIMPIRYKLGLLR